MLGVGPGEQSGLGRWGRIGICVYNNAVRMCEKQAPERAVKGSCAESDEQVLVRSCIGWSWRVQTRMVKSELWQGWTTGSHSEFGTSRLALTCIVGSHLTVELAMVPHHEILSWVRSYKPHVKCEDRECRPRVSLDSWI